MKLRPTAFTSSFILHPSSLSLLFLLAARGAELLGLLDGLLEPVAVLPVLEAGERLGRDDRAADHLQRQLDAVRHLRARGDLREVYPELHHRLRDGGRDAR